MPTVLRRDGLRVSIYPNDHRPAHVHVIGAGGEAVVLLNCSHGPPELRESYGLTQPALGRIMQLLAEGLTVLCEKWVELHGRE